MRIGVHLGHWEHEPSDPVPLAREAERAGFDSVWVSETWGSDALVLLTWIAAHTERIGLGTAVMQIPGRTPAAAAMAALTLDHLSGGRLRLGLGVSGPQVVEGWHGVPFDGPLERTREFVEIVRRILRREEPLVFEGARYRIPTAEGLGKPLKANVLPLRADLPIYLAALGPRNVALAAEIADGWLPILYSPYRHDVFDAHLEEGLARSGRDAAGFEIAPMVQVVIGPDVAQCRDAVRASIALYVGGMGARGANFYNLLVRRYGYEREAARIQDLFLDGRRAEATVAVPDALVEEIALVGPVERIRGQLDAWRAAGVTTLLAKVSDVETIRALAEAAA